MGDTVKIHRIKMCGNIEDTTSTVNTVRIMVVRWANNDFADIDLNSVLQDNAANGAPWSMIDHNTPYQILVDKRVRIGIGGGLSPSASFYVDKRFKNPLTAAYDPAATTGTYSDTQKGLIRVYACADTGANAAILYSWQVYFTDV